MKIQEQIDQLLDLVIQEDLCHQDITSDALVPKHAMITTKISLKSAGVVAGLPFFSSFYKKIDPNIKVTLYVEEGSYQSAGTVIGKVSGPAKGIISGKRQAFNLLEHTSGVASLTYQFVKKVEDLECQILDTRRTLPGLRALEKYAVQIGGGVNHRYNLNDRFIIKSNHLSYVETESRTPIIEAVAKAKKYKPNTPIEIEITEINQVDEAIQTDVQAIILNGMTPKQIAQCVEKIRPTHKKIYVDSPAGITLETIRVFAETGVDGISVGELTHSVPPLPFRMRMTI